MNQKNKGKMVLVVEDSPTQSIHMKNLLESNGLRCSLATNGRTGLYLAQNTVPDAIILDLEMPHMNGFEVCKQLKAGSLTADIPVIVMTHHDETDAVVEGLQLGAIEFIPKDTFADIVLIETLKQMHIIEVN
jgi:DNA-binding response OmpR family regulator